MSNPELSPDHRPATAEDEETHELRGILDTIAAQLTDADRRHSATLSEMQERLAEMGHHAEMMRHRMPEQFEPAFARIENGIAELAGRLDAGGDAHDPDIGSGSPTSQVEPDAARSDSPMALRSAEEPASTRHPWRSDSYARRTEGVDPFDVIESSVPGDTSDPWDRSSAEALADLYESGAASYGQIRLAHFGEPTDAARYDPHAALPTPRPSDHVIDSVWLESRFAEIARSIEQSLAHSNSDNGFHAIGERLDRFENEVAKLSASVAGAADIASVQRLGEHVSEVVDHLVHTQEQLTRLTTIEGQLALISHALHGEGTAAGGLREAFAGSRLDVDAIARAAAQETAQRLSTDLSHSAADELRPLIERLMLDTRQGEEHTATLLDSIQRAIVRLLDRVDSIESVQQQAPAAPRLTVAEEREPHALVVAAQRDFSLPPRLAGGMRDTVAPPLAADKPVSVPPLPAGEAQSQHDKRRADLVADARRAKMRLAAAASEDTLVITAPGATASGVSSATLGSKPIRPAASSIPKSSAPSWPSPRLIIMALAAVLALGVLWYKFHANGTQLSLPQPVSQAPSQPASQAETSSNRAEPDGASPSTPSPANGASSSDTKAPAATGPRSEASPSESIGQNTLDEAARRTVLPMIGVAVDEDRQVSQSSLQQARRHQAMANMSGQLGAAAAKLDDARRVPDAIVPTGSESESAAPQQAAFARSGPLDLPAASVGPLSLRLAAANGDPSAEFEVGARFAEGKGTPQSFGDAAKWYQRAADRGFAQAEYRLGTLYERGLGLKPDRALAEAWYKRAADQGNIKAMHNLAVLSANQSDQSPDYTTAAQWFTEAANRGLPDSQFNLAVLYENGLGVTRDLKQAFMWLSLAGRDGDADAVRRRDILRGKLTADEIAVADRMIASWKAIPVDLAVNDARTAGEAWKKNPKNGVDG